MALFSDAGENMQKHIYKYNILDTFIWLTASRPTRKASAIYLRCDMPYKNKLHWHPCRTSAAYLFTIIIIIRIIPHNQNLSSKAKFRNVR